MKEIFLIVQLLSNIPADLHRAPLAEIPQGTGTLLVAACAPGDPVLVTPGYFQGVAGKDGIAKIEVPAQSPKETAYRINGEEIHGTVGNGETLSAVCP